ncbi:MAG: EscN/YscN/HrcN family type III secretion system ATPase, partial [Candidatus Marinimicrobia bacterium]|nr:EscN/YscN/HrcN family type III secretion system ATPase [Candidatus Neomarinimicrobiota bacterium]
EYFSDEGNDVMLMMDSLTRVAMAQREIGLAIGEPPTTKGYTPSVFALLPRLLERAGPSQGRYITGIYTVLVESDDLNDPIADAARSLLDGHVVLSRALANRGQFPAVDPLQSVSRLRRDITPPEQIEDVQRIIELMSVYNESEDLINIGAYSAGSNTRIDEAIANIDSINDYLKQGGDVPSDYANAREMLRDLCQKLVVSDGD